MKWMKAILAIVSMMLATVVVLVPSTRSWAPTLLLLLAIVSIIDMKRTLNNDGKELLGFSWPTAIALTSVGLLAFYFATKRVDTVGIDAITLLLTGTFALIFGFGVWYVKPGPDQTRSSNHNI